MLRTTLQGHESDVMFCKVRSSAVFSVGVYVRNGFRDVIIKVHLLNVCFIQHMIS